MCNNTHHLFHTPCKKSSRKTRTKRLQMKQKQQAQATGYKQNSVKVTHAIRKVKKSRSLSQSNKSKPYSQSRLKKRQGRREGESGTPSYRRNASHPHRTIWLEVCCKVPPSHVPARHCMGLRMSSAAVGGLVILSSCCDRLRAIGRALAERSGLHRFGLRRSLLCHNLSCVELDKHGTIGFDFFNRNR